MWLILLFTVYGYLSGVQGGLPSSASFLLKHSDKFGLELPGYMKLLSGQRSSVLSTGLHLALGNHLETHAKDIVVETAKQIPESTNMKDMKDIQVNGKTVHLTGGSLSGLKSITFPPKGQVDVIIDKGFPAFVFPVSFKSLQMKFSYDNGGKTGTAEASLNDGDNFVLKLRLFPNPVERCYLNLYDVVLTDIQDIDFKMSGEEVSSGGGGFLSILASAFKTSGGPAEERIKNQLGDMLFHYIPVASPAICDNSKEDFRVSAFKPAHPPKKRVEV